MKKNEVYKDSYANFDLYKTVIFVNRSIRDINDPKYLNIKY